MFEPGKSGNPRGRPAKTQQQRDFEAKCAGYSALYAFDKLKAWIDGEDKKVAQWAMSEMLNRGFGKPVETAYVEANLTTEIGASPDEIAGAIADLIGPAVGSGGGGSQENPVDGPK